MMKKVMLGLVLGLLLIGCVYDDDYLDSTVFLKIEDAIQFNNQKEYMVGDTVRFEIQFSRYLEEEGYTSLLDIYETTNDENFAFDLDLKKFSNFSSEYEFMLIADTLLVGPRPDHLSYNSVNNLAVELNEAKDQYMAEIGVIMAEAGDFQLVLDFLEFSSSYGDQKVSVLIEHEFSANSTLDTEFSVVE